MKTQIEIYNEPGNGFGIGDMGFFSENILNMTGLQSKILCGKNGSSVIPIGLTIEGTSEQEETVRQYFQNLINTTDGYTIKVNGEKLASQEN